MRVCDLVCDEVCPGLSSNRAAKRKKKKRDFGFLLRRVRCFVCLAASHGNWENELALLPLELSVLNVIAVSSSSSPPQEVERVAMQAESKMMIPQSRDRTRRSMNESGARG